MPISILTTRISEKGEEELQSLPKGVHFVAVYQSWASS